MVVTLQECPLEELCVADRDVGVRDVGGHLPLDRVQDGVVPLVLERLRHHHQGKPDQYDHGQEGDQGAQKEIVGAGVPL